MDKPRTLPVMDTEITALCFQCASVDSARILKNIRQVARDLGDQNLWVLVTGFEQWIGAAFDPIRNCFVCNQSGASSTTAHIQPVRNVRTKYKDMALGGTT